MTEHLTLVASRAAEMQQYLESWQKDGWVLHSFHPPVAMFGPGAKWYATLTRDMIRLSWEPNREADVAGYRLYWTVEGEPFHLLATVPMQETSWTTNATPLRGMVYTFCVAAYDFAGNESEKKIIATVDRR